MWADASSPPPAGAEPAVPKELDQEGWTLLGGDWFQRDLEYSYDVSQRGGHCVAAALHSVDW